MRIKIGKSSIRGSEVGGGLLVGGVAANVGVGAAQAVDSLSRPGPIAAPNPFDQFDEPNPYDQFDPDKLKP
jgi:hypothetical protein